MKTTLLTSVLALSLGLLPVEALFSGIAVGNPPGTANLIGIYPSRSLTGTYPSRGLLDPTGEAGHFILTTAGDVDLDGVVREADAVQLLSWLYSDGEEPACQATCDINRDGLIDVKDANAITASALGVATADEPSSLLIFVTPKVRDGNLQNEAVVATLPPISGVKATSFTAVPELDANANLVAPDAAAARDAFVTSLYFVDSVRTAREKGVAVLAVIGYPSGDYYGFVVQPDETVE